jgi:peptidoglycan/xylan/chitin deacetylase (PgdA/CDA1 family)
VDQLFILNLHGIGVPKRELPASEQRVWLDQSRFNAILDFAKDKTNIQWTFDDANDSDHAIALPALLARGLTAQFFIVADRVDRPGYLTSNQIKELLAAGMGVGSHGWRHRPWAGLRPEDLHQEIADAKDRLELLAGIKMSTASCPFGSYNRKVIRALRDAGFARVYTSDGGPVHPGSFLIARNTLQHTCELADLSEITSVKAGLPRRVYRNLKLLMKRWR